MSEKYNNPIDSVQGYGQSVLSGDMFNASEKLQQVKSNVSFRVNSAREMVMGIRDQNAMSPMERRSEIRSRRLELIGVGDDSSSGSPTRTTPSPSGSIGERSRTDTSDNTSTSEPNTKQGGSPLMSEVNVGTKARAQERGFGQ